jgi:hypothetical protein
MNARQNELLPPDKKVPRKVNEATRPIFVQAMKDLDGQTPFIDMDLVEIAELVRRHTGLEFSESSVRPIAQLACVKIKDPQSINRAARREQEIAAVKTAILAGDPNFAMLTEETVRVTNLLNERKVELEDVTERVKAAAADATQWQEALRAARPHLVLIYKLIEQANSRFTQPT